MGWRLATFIITILVALDQLSKYWVETSLPFQQSVSVMPFLSWLRTYNEGVAFSFLSFLDDRLLVALTVLIIAFILYLWRSAGDRLVTHLGFAFIIGGAVGNLIDRALLGHVVDFIQVHTQTWSFAIFNLADIFVNIGAALFIYGEFFGAKDKTTEDQNT